MSIFLAWVDAWTGNQSIASASAMPMIEDTTPMTSIRRRSARLSGPAVISSLPLAVRTPSTPMEAAS